jgi:hypothetical protein
MSQNMDFDVISKINNIETITVNNSIHEIDRLRKNYGDGHWRKRKGFAIIRFSNGEIRNAEIHWYEAHGIGKKEIKIKRTLG